MRAPDFTALPDLASRTLGGGVPYATDELFAEKENLIQPAPPAFDPAFGHKGKVYDGWETRRRREPGCDHAVVRLGAAGVVRGVVVDTAYFTGNYPPYVSVEACAVDGYPSPPELAGEVWRTLVPKSRIDGDTANRFAVASPYRWTHIRLTIYPDGGVARLRVHGEVVPDPRFLGGTLDLAALENGGAVVDCSDTFYSPPDNLILPGRARTMGDGWENARRRDEGNDHVTFRLAGRGVLRDAVLDTSYFVGNAPGWAALSGLDAPGGGPLHDDAWTQLLPRTRLQPDTRHRFPLRHAEPVTHVRLDVYPDGGLARVRLHGELAAAARDEAATQYASLLPSPPPEPEAAS